MNNQQLIAYPQSTTLPISFPSGEFILDLFKDEPIPLVLIIVRVLIFQGVRIIIYFLIIFLILLLVVILILIKKPR